MLSIYLSMLETEEEKAAFTDLYETYRHSCLNVALKITGSQELAEDALHNAFISIIRHKEKYLSLPCCKLKSSIVIIVKNKSLDLLSVEHRKMETPVAGLSDVAQADGFDISEYVADDESYKRLLGHVSRLPEHYRVVFQLRYVHDLSNKEIAERLEESQQTIATKLHRAKKALIKILIEEGESVG